MRAIAQGQGARPRDLPEIKIPVEMGKQRPAARYFPFQPVSQCVSLNCREDQAVLSRKMFCGCFHHRFNRREVDVAVS